MQSDDPPSSRVSAWAQVRAWISIGTESIGGGASTLFLMRRVLIQRHGWIREADLTQDWALAKAAPGLTMIGLTALVGKRIDGRRGIALALGGMLIPAAAITVGLAAGLDLLSGQPAVQSALDGMGPATIGLTLAMMSMFVRSVIRDGRARFVDVAVVAIAVVVGFTLVETSAVILVAGVVLGWLALGTRPVATADATSDTDRIDSD